MGTDAHRRIEHSIAEQPAGLKLFSNALKFGRLRPWTVQKKLVVMVPDLTVTGHRLVVKADVVRRGAQKHVRQFVLGAFYRQLVFVAMNLLPAVRAAERIADGAV